MTYEMQIRIPLKRALIKMWVGLVKKRSKIPKKNAVGEPKVCGLRLLSLQIDNILVYVRLLASLENGR